MSKETVQSIHIQNFKSVVDLSLELGSFNVLIGENGCGKSNILEAIAFGAAAAADKLDYEFLGSRGIRVTNPEFMYSAFEKKTENKIKVKYKVEDDFVDEYDYVLTNDPDNSKRWLDELKGMYQKVINETIVPILSEKDSNAKLEKIQTLFLKNALESKLPEKVKHEISKGGMNNEILADPSAIFQILLGKYLADRISSSKISNFIIYAPEQSSLRKFEETNQIYPLGIKGEGLFQYLKDLAGNKKNNKVLKAIKDNLTLLDWYEKFDLPQNSLSNDFTLHIKDKYLSPDLQYFDQRSTNEGFLYLLFYSTLFLSKDTPAFFAIDNIDASLNPKLCMQLTRNLAELAQKHGKQVIVTTQNPAILDGLNLKDDQQRLFVVRRNDEGHTKATRVEYKAERKMKLSEVWTSGFIGGLPENF